VRPRHRQREASHKARIRSWALAGHVIHQDDWYNAGADGGGPIKAVRSRISELEREGHGFHHHHRPDGSVEYRLARVPEVELPEELEALEALRQEPLFEVAEQAPARTRPGFYDWDGE
jgi:hypothetical protein